MPYIDTHAHLYSEQYDTDRKEVITEALNSGIEGIIIAAVDSESHDMLDEMIKEYPDICLGTIGVHPTSINSNADYLKELTIVKERLSTTTHKYCAVGEIGLDLYWSKDFLKEQIEALKFQIELALKYDLPIILHCRDAFKEMFEVLREYSNLKGIFHGFSGTYDEYLIAKKLGNFKFGIGGVITFKNSTLSEVVKCMDLTDICLETDAPYLTPAPYRGKRNHPKHIPIIALKIADIKGVSLQEVADITTENAKSLFYGTQSLSL